LPLRRFVFKIHSVLAPHFLHSAVSVFLSLRKRRSHDANPKSEKTEHLPSHQSSSCTNGARVICVNSPPSNGSNFSHRLFEMKPRITIHTFLPIPNIYTQVLTGIYSDLDIWWWVISASCPEVQREVEEVCWSSRRNLKQRQD
jgi:hypothetical protein